MDGEKKDKNPVGILMCLMILNYLCLSKYRLLVYSQRMNFSKSIDKITDKKNEERYKQVYLIFLISKLLYLSFYLFIF